jgi:hypothetical protein
MSEGRRRHATPSYREPGMRGFTPQFGCVCMTALDLGRKVDKYGSPFIFLLSESHLLFVCS